MVDTYESVLKSSNLFPLNEGRMIILSNLLSIRSLLLGGIDCPELLSLIRLEINYTNTRKNNTFYPNQSSTNGMSLSPNDS